LWIGVVEGSRKGSRREAERFVLIADHLSLIKKDTVRSSGFFRCLVDLLLSLSAFSKSVEAAFRHEIRAAVFAPGNPAARPTVIEAQQGTAFNPLSFTMRDFLVKLCRLRTGRGSAHCQGDIDGTVALFSEDCVSLTDFHRDGLLAPI
jgi:hypothetical protein